MWDTRIYRKSSNVIKFRETNESVKKKKRMSKKEKTKLDLLKLVDRRNL